MKRPARRNPQDSIARRHLRLGWWSLLAFLSLGLVLEALHGFKIQQYVGVDHATRRLMWTLGHAHGVLLALLNVVFALTVTTRAEIADRLPALTSPALAIATLALPLGFFLGGVRVYGGDPNLSILLVPAGGLALFVAVLTTARAVR